MRRLCLPILFLLALVALPQPAHAQTEPLRGPNLPATCTTGERFQKVGFAGGIYTCISTNTWSPTVPPAPQGPRALGSGTTCPPTRVIGSAGSLYTCTGDGSLYTWDGSSWTLVVGGSGGSLSSLSDVTITSPMDTEVLTYHTSSGKWINQAASGGGLPSLGTFDQLLTVGIDATVLQPTVAQVLTAHPEIFMNPWVANTVVGYGSDVVVFTTDGTRIFHAEVSEGNAVGSSTPDFPSAVNPGDTVSDGDVTWVLDDFLLANWPPTPTTWQANHAYTMPSFIWPTAPNGHVYAPYGDYTSDSSEPEWGTTLFDYTSDGGGYRMDAGGALGASWTDPLAWLARRSFATIDLATQSLSILSDDGFTYAANISPTAVFLQATSGVFRLAGIPSGGSGKKVVCIDTATSRLYVSATGTDCSD